MTQKMNLLFIDDSKIDNYHLSCLLETEQVPAQAQFIRHPAQALDYLRQVDPAEFPTAIFVDVNMPVMNGFELAEAYLLEFYLQHPNTRLFMMSTTPHKAIIDELADNPIISDFLPKPFNRETFTTKVYPHLQQSTTPLASAIG